VEIRPKIAIVDDEVHVRETLACLLDDNGFDPVPMEGSRQLLVLREFDELNLALIDLKLRGESGLALAQQIRATSDLPIIMLTGVGDEVDKVIGLETGADDYVMKPYDPRELIARIRAILRRCGTAPSPPLAGSGRDSDRLGFGTFTLDFERAELTAEDGEIVPLTNGEYSILEYFVRNPNRIITRPELLEALGADLSKYMDRTIDVMILRLRRKIEKVPSKPRHLQTRRGQGYVFVNEAAPEA